MFCPLVVGTLLALAPHSITEIQGASLVSPLQADSVSTTGVVTALTRDGFYLQDAGGDGNDATSDAVFVRSAATVFVGDEVRVAGVVEEFLPSNDSANLTVTEIAASGVTRLRAGVALPATVWLARAARFPRDGDGIAFWESLEGMRVGVHSPRVVEASYASEECWVAPTDAVFSARGVLAVGPGAFHPERVRLLAPSLPVLRPGDVLSDVTGVVSYDHGNYALVLETPPTSTSGHLSREVATLSSSDRRVRVASFNLRNLGRDDSARMDEVARLVVSHLGTPEIIGLEEVVDDSGSRNDGVVDATLTLRALTAAVRRADGPAYDFREVLPGDGADGGAPGNNIRVALLFDPARVTFVDRGDSSGDAETRFVAHEGRPRLTRSPGRVLPGDPAWVQSRKPLACELRVHGETLFVVVCHFVSKSRSSPLYGAAQPPLDPDGAKRRRQAQLVASFAGDALAIDPAARVVVLGDLNDDWFSAPVAVLESGLLTDLWNAVTPEERYSIIYDGNAQAFDHVLVSPALRDDARVDVVHVSAEFPDGVSDHDPVLAAVRVSAPAAQTEPPKLIVSPGRPNPFNASVTLDVVGDHLHATIFDVVGRRVRAVTINNYSILWDGRDDAGHRVPAGVYWVRVSDGAVAQTRRVVLVR